MPLILYKVDLSGPVRAVYMTMDVLGLKPKMVDINTWTGENRTPEYLDKNPMHTVPVLEDGDFILSDSHSIITYLVSKYGAKTHQDLYPKDYKIRATVDQRLYYDASVLFMRFKPIMQSIGLEKKTSATPESLADVEEAYTVLEKYLEKQEFLADNKLTLADISVVATVSSFEIFLPVTEKFPKLFSWLEKMKNTEFYKRSNEPGLEQLKEFWEKIIEKNN